MSGDVEKSREELVLEITNLRNQTQRRREQRQTGTAKARASAAQSEELSGERAKRVEAERIGRIKDEFLANLSHELRTPLNAILGWSQLLKAGESNAEELAEGLDVIRRNARTQVQLIDDLLDMNRIVSGKLRLDVQRVELSSAIQAAVEVVHLAAEAKGVRLETVVDPLAGPIMGDPGRLQQVIWNLLSNAIKFTPRGGIVQITVERANSHVELSVSDTGRGIDPDFLPHVFERFTQADSGLTKNHSGLGLGLAIVKNLAELHGGSIRVKSGGENRGCTFILSLPISVVRSLSPDEQRQHPTTVESESPPTPDLTGTTVLVVDDNVDALRLVRHALRKCGARVSICESAAECLALLPQLRPDVLITDIGMPQVDGYALIRAVRALAPERGGAVPAVALTAFARSEDRRRAMLAGFDIHVARPAEPSELVAVVARLARRT